MTILDYQSAPPQDSVPRYRLYTPGAVLLAAFLGSPAAGCVLMALNYRRLGQKAAAWKTIVVGFLGTVALCVFSIVGIDAIFGDSSTATTISKGLLIGALSAIYQTAKQLQGRQIQQHLAKGGKRASYWKAAGTGLVFMVIVLAAIVLPMSMEPSALHGVMGITTKGGTPPRVVTINSNEEILLSGDASESMARTTAATLSSLGVFDGKTPKTVFIGEEAGEVTVSFVTSTSVSPEVEASFKAIGATIATALDIKSITVRLLDSDLVERDRIAVP